MTYTLRCPRTGALGVSIATYSLAVGSKCPAIVSNVGAITTQAFVNPTLKALGLRLLGLGHPSAQVLELLRGADSDFEFRQVALVDRNGRVACHTGSRTRPWAGHQIGDGFAALGNVLKGEAVAWAMAEAFRPALRAISPSASWPQSRPDVAPVASTGSTARCRSALRTCLCMRRTSIRRSTSGLIHIPTQ